MGSLRDSSAIGVFVQPGAMQFARACGAILTISFFNESRKPYMSAFIDMRINHCTDETKWTHHSCSPHSLHSQPRRTFLPCFQPGRQPRVGDAVIINESDLPGKISRVLDGEGKALYEVEVDHGRELDRATLEVKEFRVAARSLTSQWKNRTIKIDDIVPMVQPKVLKQSLSPSKNSLFSSASARTARPKPLSKIGLVVTLSTNVDDPDAMRNGLQQSIKSNGGVLLDDWSCVLPITAKRTAKRWIITQNDFKYKPMEGMDKVFLLSDDANQKAKYLVALALGIPCLEMSWLNSLNEEEGLDAWQTYLLPAGLSEHLNARVSQIVDLDWGTCKEHLSEVLTNPVATKLLTGKSVLLLGTEYFPPSTGRRRSVKQGSSGPDNGNMDSVPRIILAMGAARVEVVADAKSALDTKLTSYDYVIVKDESSPVYTNAKADVTCVPMQWVKDCLISGRLLPLTQR
ncbi:hypothetical protein EWM64_g2453 [Hericium alpestre]|uniref:BRCT domain-containing protein n=1 Tax=Hericium alpestre TaxID=135208 RepID=A0A4Z0A5P9_9AGAM|nr:hypothetical protein EWM64_g2453 [Hericium alpestre]